jgi:hypothetical protein
MQTKLSWGETSMQLQSLSDYTNTPRGRLEGGRGLWGWGLPLQRWLKPVFLLLFSLGKLAFVSWWIFGVKTEMPQLSFSPEVSERAKT